MHKNSIIALIIGLIIGGLVIFLVMGFTNLGSTMIVNYQGEKIQKVSPITPPTSGNEVTASYDFTTTEINTPTIITKDGKSFSAKFTASGNYATEGKKKIAAIKSITITGASTDLIGFEKEISTDSTLKNTKFSATEFDKVMNFYESGIPGADMAAKQTMTNEMFNVEGTSDTAMNNKAKLASSANDFRNVLKTATNADDWYLAADMKINYSDQLEQQTITMLEEAGIDEAGFASWLGRKLGTFIRWCLDWWDEFSEGFGEGFGTR